MMNDLRDLYQEMVIDHGRHPRNFHAIQEANRQAQGFNRLCGDKITLYLTVENGIIQDISFQGSGCAIATASASLMTEQLKGKTEQQAHAFFESFHHILTDDITAPNAEQKLGKLAVLANVRAYPARVKCATLAWHTLQAALKNQTTLVSTEDDIT